MTQKKMKFKKVKHIPYYVILLIVLLAIGIIFLSEGKITGHINADVYETDINAKFSESSIFDLSKDIKSAVPLSSFRISGQVVGDGKVKVHLVNEKGEKFLVYTNIIENKNPSITAFISDENKKIEVEKVKADVIFEDRCVDTCSLDRTDEPYQLVIEVEEGTTFVIDSVIYTLLE